VAPFSGNCHFVGLAVALTAVASVGALDARASTWEADTLATVGSVGSWCDLSRDAAGDLHVA